MTALRETQGTRVCVHPQTQWGGGGAKPKPVQAKRPTKGKGVKGLIQWASQTVSAQARYIRIRQEALRKLSRGKVHVKVKPILALFGRCALPTTTVKLTLAKFQ